MRARAENGKAAMTVFERAERGEAALKELVAKVEANIEVALGILLTKRRVNVGEVVGSWAKTRGNSAKRELSKTEFKDEVERLGLTVKGQPATRKQLGALFDTVDKDGSGCVRLTRSNHCPIPCTRSYVRYC